MCGRRSGVALALVLAALVLAGALAAGAVMAASQAMRDATGALARAQALAAAESALAQALTAPEWDTAWDAPAPPGLVALRAHTAPGGWGDSVRVVRLNTESLLVIAEGYAGAAPRTAARARLAVLIVLDGSAHPLRAAAHSWSPMP